jgi:chromosome segregation protein
VPISSIVEAARVPQQLLGSLFVEKGLITPEELQEALEEQKTSGERIGQILVKRGLVSGPVLTTVLAEQLGVQMEKQEGFGAGLWSEIKRRHPRGRQDDDMEPAKPKPEYGPLEADERRLALIDDLDEGVPERVDDDRAELDSLRQQVTFASNRLEEERAGHKGTLRLLEESRRELERLAREVDDWRERAARAEESDAKEQAVTDLAGLEATVTELRAELAARERELEERDGSETVVQLLSEQIDELRLEGEEARRLLDEARADATSLDETVTELRAAIDARDRELAAGAEIQTQLAAEAGRLEDALRELRDEHSGSKDAIAALTAQVDELRIGAADAQRLLNDARVEAAALEATRAELRFELDKARKEGSESQAAVTALTEQLGEERASGDELERKLEEARADASAFEVTVGELREELSSRGDVGELEQELAAVRENASRLEEISDKRKTKVKELHRLLEDERARSAAAATELAQELTAAHDKAAGLEQRVGEREHALARDAEARAAVEADLEALRAEAAELRRQVAQVSELEQELAAVREHVTRLEEVSDKRKTEVNELHRLLEDERARSAAAATELAQELTAAHDKAAGLEQRVGEREHALAREAEARAAVELQLASLGAGAEALDQRLQEECVAHVATRRELSRVEEELAELHRQTDKLAATESELSACARLLEEVSAGLESAKDRLGERDVGEADPDRHVVFIPLEGVYALAERPGPSPAVGAYEDVDGVRFLVSRIGPSPLPDDRRRCAYLEVP